MLGRGIIDRRASKRHVISSGVALAAALAFILGQGAEAANNCASIMHRANGSQWVEETIPAIKEAAKWKWGAELDARVTSDCAVVMVHDKTIKRITNYQYDWVPEEKTLAELRSITLPDGNKIATIKEAIRTAANDNTYIQNPKLMIEIKDYPTYQSQWDSCGFDVIDGWLSYYDMYDKVYLGSAAATNYISTNYPTWKTFWRADADDTPTASFVQSKGYDLVQLDPNVYSYTAQLQAIPGLIVSSRNVHNTDAVAAAYAAGLRRFQTNNGNMVNNYCEAIQN